VQTDRFAREIIGFALAGDALAATECQPVRLRPSRNDTGTDPPLACRYWLRNTLEEVLWQSIFVRSIPQVT